MGYFRSFLLISLPTIYIFHLHIWIFGVAWWKMNEHHSTFKLIFKITLLPSESNVELKDILASAARKCLLSSMPSSLCKILDWDCIEVLQGSSLCKLCSACTKQLG